MPLDDASAEAKMWVRNNAKAMFLISSSMEFAQFECLLSCTSAKQMWDKLGQIHEQKSASNKLMLTQKFFQYQMGPNDSAVTHITKVQNLASQIADVGKKLSEVTIMAKIWVA